MSVRLTPAEITAIRVEFYASRDGKLVRRRFLQPRRTRTNRGWVYHFRFAGVSWKATRAPGGLGTTPGSLQIHNATQFSRKEREQAWILMRALITMQVMQ